VKPLYFYRNADMRNGQVGTCSPVTFRLMYPLTWLVGLFGRKAVWFVLFWVLILCLMLVI